MPYNSVECVTAVPRNSRVLCGMCMDMSGCVLLWSLWCVTHFIAVCTGAGPTYRAVSSADPSVNSVQIATVIKRRLHLCCLSCSQWPVLSRPTPRYGPGRQCGTLSLLSYSEWPVLSRPTPRYGPGRQCGTLSLLSVQLRVAGPEPSHFPVGPGRAGHYRSNGSDCQGRRMGKGAGGGAAISSRRDTWASLITV